MFFCFFVFLFLKNSLFLRVDKRGNSADGQDRCASRILEEEEEGEGEVKRGQLPWEECGFWRNEIHGGRRSL